MIIQEDEDLKKEKFDVNEICRCDELSKFYKKATHCVYPPIRYQDKDFKLEPFEVRPYLSIIIVNDCFSKIYILMIQVGYELYYLKY